jgi:hypothetical protein
MLWFNPSRISTQYEFIYFHARVSRCPHGLLVAYRKNCRDFRSNPQVFLVYGADGPHRAFSSPSLISASSNATQFTTRRLRNNTERRKACAPGAASGQQGKKWTRVRGAFSQSHVSHSALWQAHDLGNDSDGPDTAAGSSNDGRASRACIDAYPRAAGGETATRFIITSLTRGS